MRLAEDIAIILAGEVVVLHPALRHAINLQRARPGSFTAVVAALDEGSLTVAADIIRPHHPHPMLLNRIFEAGVDKLKPALIDYVAACAGIDTGRPKAKQAKVNGTLPTESFADHLVSLFKIGTGWLGWTPNQALDATPAEIRLAYEGRIELLRAIFGSAEEEADDRPLDDKFRAVFGGFGTTKVKREATP